MKIHVWPRIVSWATNCSSWTLNRSLWIHSQQNPTLHFYIEIRHVQMLIIPFLVCRTQSVLDDFQSSIVIYYHAHLFQILSLVWYVNVTLVFRFMRIDQFSFSFSAHWHEGELTPNFLKQVFPNEKFAYKIRLLKYHIPFSLCWGNGNPSSMGCWSSRGHW